MFIVLISFELRRKSFANIHGMVKRLWTIRAVELSTPPSRGILLATHQIMSKEVLTCSVVDLCMITSGVWVCVACE